MRSFTLQFAWRDSRRGRRRLLLFLSAMALGVAALVAIQSFSDQLAARPSRSSAAASRPTSTSACPQT
jgi:predicted lysophospholipase L1 biosynthesis ABC-type transport system permease subunit